MALDRVYRDLERPLIPVLAAMERAGVRIDGGGARRAVAARRAASWRARRAQIFELAGESFNINSPKQLSEILFDKLQLPALKRNVKTRPRRPPSRCSRSWRSSTTCRG